MPFRDSLWRPRKLLDGRRKREAIFRGPEKPGWAKQGLAVPGFGVRSVLPPVFLARGGEDARAKRCARSHKREKCRARIGVSGVPR